MSFLETLLTSLLSSGIWLVALSFLARSLIGSFLAKDLEILKGRISAANIEKQIVLARIHENRAAAIADIHRALGECLDASKNFVWRAEHVTEEERVELVAKIDSSSNEFQQVFRKNRLYLSQSTCNSIDEVFGSLRKPVFKYIFSVGRFKSAESMTDGAFMSEFEIAFEEFADRIPRLIEKLENEFRVLLGVETPALG